MSILRSTLTIGGFTLISRIFGFIRDILIASFVGANAMSDAFFVSLKLPNFMRRLFAEGAFNSAFVPLFTGMMVSEGREKALRFAQEAKSVLVLILLVLTLLAELFMPYVVMALAPGFSDDPEKFQLTVNLTRITFPYLLLISLTSLYGGMLNSINKFAAVAAAPILMNLCLIASLLLLRVFTETPAYALSIGVLLSGIAQWAWLLYFCHKEKMLPGFVYPRLTENVKTLLKLIGPGAFGAGVVQVNLVIDTIIATHIEDGVSYLYYADRVNEFPLGVIGIAVGTAMLPLLSRLFREARTSEAMYSLNRALELAMILSLPAAAALMVIAEPVIATLFQRGAFDAHDTQNTYTALVAFSAGLPAFVLVKVLAPVFFANQDTKTPVKIAIGCVLLNLVLNLSLMEPFKHVGLAMATSISGWVNAGFFIVILRRRKLFMPDQVLRDRMIRIVAACALMMATLLGLSNLLQSWLHAGEAMRALGVILLISLGFLSYAAGIYYLKVVNKVQLKSYFRRSPKP